MSEASLRRRHGASHRSFYRALARGAPNSSLIEIEGGVQATVVPSRPERSILNAVLYEEGDTLIPALPELKDRYAQAGITGWGVWVRPGDDEVPSALDDNGLTRDSWPTLMAAPLDELDLESRSEVDLHPAPTFASVAEINDLAYGILPDWSLGAALSALEDPATHAHIVAWQGRPAACAVSHHHDDDCYLYLVATIPEARGQGLASELMRALLREARAAGCTTTSLESTAMAKTLYGAIGYRALGPIEMWEHRTW